MSTKTTFKRIALVAVAGLGLGMLSAVAPANAAVSQSLVASVGPNGETSLTVVGSSPAALVRLDVTSNDSTTVGLQANESITASVVGVPTASGKTLAVNGGSLNDTTTAWSSTANRSDFSMVETRGQSTGGVVGTVTTGGTARAVATDWTKLASFAANSYNDSSVAGTPAAAVVTNSGSNPSNADGVLGSGNTGYVNMDSNLANSTSGNFVKSYYVTIIPRTSATVIDQGAYTFQFQLTDANGVVRGTKTVKIDFVSAAAKSDAVVTLTPAGAFVKGTSILPYDTQTGASAAASLKVTLKNRDGGLVRTSAGAAPAPTVTIQTSTSAAPTMVDSTTVTVADDGTYGSDWGSDADGFGVGSLHSYDGVYGATFTVPQNITSTTAGSLRSYQFWAAYGNSAIVTSALTVYDSTTITASAANTDAILTGVTGTSAADALLKSNTATHSWTVPSTTTSGTVKFYIQTSNDTAVAAADITVTPTWSGTFGTASVTPATSTTGTVYTTDSTGLITVSFANSAPADTAKLTLVLTGAKAFGNSRVTATITWAKAAATTLKVVDPLSGVYVKTGSTNVTTIKVTDQFGAPVAGDIVKVALSDTSANYSATTTIAPITTGAAGTATFSLVGGATTATLDKITFTSTSAAAPSDSITYNYVTTVPAVATLSGYYSTDFGATSPNTLVASTGIYSSGTTKLLLKSNRNLSADLTGGNTDASTDDQVALRFYGLTSASAAASGAVVTVTAGDGGWLLDALTGLPVKSRSYLIGTTGYTGAIQVLATKPGDITFTATSGTASATAVLKVDNASTDGRFVKLTQESGVVTATVTDRYGNGVSGATVQISTTAGSLGNGQMTTVYTTDLSGKVAVIPAGQADATITATATSTGDYASLAGYVGSTLVDSSLAAGNKTATLAVTLATASSSDAIDAANEATDAANAATDAANAAAEAADAATAAAQDAQAAVAALATQVASLIAGIKAQITTLTNLVVKIQKKVKA